ncbi:MAG: hypothetical protein LC623_02295 [Halobacteriales archaeon]|nr:hypothetical protein [Halobacteriales archaeon]
MVVRIFPALLLVVLPAVAALLPVLQVPSDSLASLLLLGVTILLVLGPVALGVNTVLRENSPSSEDDAERALRLLPALLQDDTLPEQSPPPPELRRRKAFWHHLGGPPRTEGGC